MATRPKLKTKFAIAVFDAAALVSPPGYTCFSRGDHVLQVVQHFGDKDQYVSHGYIFDFLNRVVHTSQHGAQGMKTPITATGSIPFSQFDSDSLQWHYHKLVSMGKTPRPLGDASPFAQKPKPPKGKA